MAVTVTNPTVVAAILCVLLAAMEGTGDVEARPHLPGLQELSHFDFADAELDEVAELASEDLQNAITRMFRSEHIANIMRQMSKHRLYLQDTEANIEHGWVFSATGLSMTAPAMLGVSTVTLDLRYPNIALVLSLGDICLEGEFRAQAPGDQRKDGSFKAIIRGLSARGRLGLRVDGDSLMPSGIYLQYEASGVDLEVTFSGGETAKYEPSKIDSGLVHRLMDRLSPALDLHLRPILSEAILEESLFERLRGDEDTVRKYKKHAKRASTLAATVVENVLKASGRARAEVPLPDVQLKSGGEWLRAGQVVLNGAEFEVDGEPCIARVGSEILVFAKLRLGRVQMEADWSGSTRGPGHLTADSTGSVFDVRFGLDAVSSAPTLRLKAVSLTELSTPQVTAPGASAQVQTLLADTMSALLTDASADAVESYLLMTLLQA